MQTVNSLSGGKTSSYLAYHYPADLEVFALCCIDSHNAGAHIDKQFKQKVNDRLQKYCAHQLPFVATSEHIKTLEAIFDLEQLLGREIIWLRGIGWEDMIYRAKYIPNQQARFCTSILKIEPIFEFLYKYHELPVKMRIGYRYDELERQQRFTDSFKFPYKSEYQPNSNRWIKRWKEIVWRVGEFPLIDGKIIHPMIVEFFKDKNIIFPEDSNCSNCFWKPEQQLRKNFDDNINVMLWAMVMEVIQGNTFKKESSLLQVKDMGLQLEFMFGTGSGCQAGFCTD